MQNALRVDHNTDPLRRNIKEPARLNHFERLVHEGSGVDRDLPAHLPPRMRTRFFHGNSREIHSAKERTELVARAAKERTARAGEPDHCFFTLGRSRCSKRLENRRVLRIHGKQFSAALPDRLLEKRAAADNAFLIG